MSQTKPGEKIYWYCDEVGNFGKSSLGLHLYLKNMGKYYISIMYRKKNVEKQYVDLYPIKVII